ncbi:hypothetical protein GOP47_0008028 [Adiantum capillus-veneris]|uniref:Uncharacterized protein n=1 Tax=Adiantum capillus-veneris TaxID=13818 RepID=A0A9D4UYJ8_ADICA|nr:hypothetical protein GOP47_0008028 [Adiantum capillus-veneris]
MALDHVDSLLGEIIAIVDAISGSVSMTSKSVIRAAVLGGFKGRVHEVGRLPVENIMVSPSPSKTFGFFWDDSVNLPETFLKNCEAAKGTISQEMFKFKESLEQQFLVHKLAVDHELAIAKANEQLNLEKNIHL